MLARRAGHLLVLNPTSQLEDGRQTGSNDLELGAAFAQRGLSCNELSSPFHDGEHALDGSRPKLSFYLSRKNSTGIAAQ